MRGLGGFAPLNLAEEVLLPFLEEVVRKLPSVRDNLPETISVELAYEAGKIIMLKIIRKQIPRKIGWPPHYKRRVTVSPRDDMVRCGIVDKLVSFSQEWGWNRLVRV